MYKYLLVTGIYPPDIGGPATYIPALETILLKKNCNVTTFSLTNRKNYIEISDQRKNIFLNRRKFLPLRVFQTSLILRKEMKKSDFVLANGLFLETAIAGLFLKKNKIAKVVGDPVWERFRNKTGSKLSVQKFNTGIQLNWNLRIQRKLLVWSLNSFNKIICPSPQLRELIEEWGVVRPCEVISNGVKEKFLRTSPSNKIYDVISVSRLVSWKNINLIIQASSQLNLRTAIIGTGPEEVALRKMAKDLNAKVDFLGDQTQDQISSLMEKSKIFCLISDYEGMSYSLLNAMMHGVGILVSNSEGNTNVIRHMKTGYILPTIDLKELCLALKNVLGTPDTLSGLGKAAREIALAEYSEQNQLNKCCKLFEDIENTTYVYLIDPRGNIGIGGYDTVMRHSFYAKAFSETGNKLNPHVLGIIGSGIDKKILENNANIEIYNYKKSNRFSLLFILFAVKTIRKNNASNIGLIAGDPWESYLTAWLISKCLSKKFNPRIQIQIHGDIFNKKWRRINLTNQMRYFLLKITLKGAKNYRVVNARSAKNLEDIFKVEKSRIFIAPVPLNISNTNFKKFLTNRPHVAGVLSRFEKDRNIEFLYTIWEKFLYENSSFKFVIAGEGSLLNSVKSQVAQLQIGECVEFMGHVDSKNLDLFWEKIGVLFSTAKLESYGRSIRESLARGIPVIAIENETLLDLKNSNIDAPLFLIKESNWVDLTWEFVVQICDMGTKEIKCDDELVQLQSLMKSWIDLIEPR